MSPGLGGVGVERGSRINPLSRTSALREAVFGGGRGGPDSWQLWELRSFLVPSRKHMQGSSSTGRVTWHLLQVTGGISGHFHSLLKSNDSQVTPLTPACDTPACVHTGDENDRWGLSKGDSRPGRQSDSSKVTWLVGNRPRSRRGCGGCLVRASWAQPPLRWAPGLTLGNRQPP